MLKNVMNDFFFFNFCQGNSSFFVLTVQFYLYFLSKPDFSSLFSHYLTRRLCHLRKIVTMFENKTYNNENKLCHQYEPFKNTKTVLEPFIVAFDLDQDQDQDCV